MWGPLKTAERMLGNENGQALVMVALLMVVLMGFAAFTVDLGVARAARVQMQSAADAAALAGAQELPNTAKARETAEKLARANGAEEISVTTPYGSDADKIEVVCAKNVPYSFAGVLGLSETEVPARAVAARSTLRGPLDYAVFSGDENFDLQFNHSNITVRGSVHSNYKCSINGTNLMIEGSVEAVSSFMMNGTNQTITGSAQGSSIMVNGTNQYIGNRVHSGAPVIDMLDFTDIVKAEAAAAGTVIHGNKVFGGTNINIDSPIYIDGNLTVNGTNFTGKGVILASGNIMFNGTNMSSLGGESVCFYSESGNILMNGNNIELKGLVYAPKGMIQFNVSSLTVKGRVIGNRVQFNGTGISVLAGTKELEGLPKAGVKLVE